MWDWVNSFFNYAKHSEAAIYALSLSTIAPLMWKLPTLLYKSGVWLKDKFIISYEFHYSDATFTDFNDWLKENPQYVFFNRALRVYSDKTVQSWDTRASSLGSSWGIIPSYGTCVLKPKSAPFMLMTRKQEEKKDLMLPADTIHLKSFLWNKNKINNFIQSINNTVNEADLKWIYFSNKDHFRKIKKIDVSVDLDRMPEEFLQVYEDIDNFFKDRPWYLERGVPHRKGYIFYGEPGTGKSRSAILLAHLLKKDLYIIQNADFYSLQDLLNRVSDGSIILMEEIDTAPVKKREDGPNDITVSVEREGEESFTKKVKEQATDPSPVKNYQETFMAEVLNALDGVLSYEGSVIIATTNYINKLDKAVIREGRFDKKIEFKPYNEKLIEKAFRSFYNFKGELKVNCGPKTIAKLNAIMFANRYDYKKAAKEIGIEVSK